jgi:hypothetical protein
MTCSHRDDGAMKRAIGSETAEVDGDDRHPKTPLPFSYEGRKARRNVCEGRI